MSAIKKRLGKSSGVSSSGSSPVAMEVISVKVSRGNTPSIDLDSQGADFLEKYKFTGIRPLGDTQKHLEAFAPIEPKVLLECKLKPGSPFKLFLLEGKTKTEIETGHIFFVDQNLDNEIIRVTGYGGEFVDWEITAGPVGIQRVEPGVQNGQQNGNAGQPQEGNEDVDASGIHWKKTLPSTAAVMIDFEVSRRKQMAEESEVQIAGVRKGVGKQTSIGLPSRPTRKRPETWPYNDKIAAHMDQLYGGDQRVTSISVALHKIMAKENCKLGYLVTMFGEYPTTIGLILAVCRLHPELQPMLDKPKKDPDYINPYALRILVKIPMEKQISIWTEAKKAAEKDEKVNVVGKLEEIADDHIRQFGRKCLWTGKATGAIPGSGAESQSESQVAPAEPVATEKAETEVVVSQTVA